MMTETDKKSPSLYFTPDTCSLATLITCFDAGLEPNVIFVDFAISQQSAGNYVSINPKARVPALSIGADVLTETPAILAYLAQTHSDANLAPKDALGFAQVQSFNAYLCSTLHVAHAHRMRGYRWVDGLEHEEAMRRKVPEAMTECYNYIEQHAFKGPFAFGEDYTISDPYLFTITQWMESDGVDPDLFPKLSAHRTLMTSRNTVKKALAVEQNCLSQQP